MRRIKILNLGLKGSIAITGQILMKAILWFFYLYLSLASSLVHFEQAPAWLVIIANYQIGIGFLCVCPLIDDKLHHNIVSRHSGFGTTSLRRVVLQQTLTML